MSPLRKLALAALPAVVLAGCGGGGGEAMDTASAQYSARCREAVAEAAEEAPQPDGAQLDPAIAACGGLAELMQATRDRPGALGGDDVEALVERRCQASDYPGVAGSVLCLQSASPGTDTGSAGGGTDA